MRVISGSLRGLKLDSLPGLDTRPTLDRVKEALFSMLFDRVTDSVGLDLFAGSGGLGIELLSRYGKECTFVDESQDALNVVRSNIRKAHLESVSQVVHSDAIAFLNRTDKKYDIIFLDPPYASGLYTDVLSVIKARGLLAAGGLIVCECDANFVLSPEGYSILKDKKYGKVRVYLLTDDELN